MHHPHARTQHARTISDCYYRPKLPARWYAEYVTPGWIALVLIGWLFVALMTGCSLSRIVFVLR